MTPTSPKQPRAADTVIDFALSKQIRDAGPFLRRARLNHRSGATAFENSAAVAAQTAAARGAPGFSNSAAAENVLRGRPVDWRFRRPRASGIWRKNLWPTR
ncbi:hypothetical protein CR492_09755 [Methylocella silvestris]|uniref:Uncharacterized protein n=1 Tax=Methylocella silvestris TaxID=199596 RepID=A0A2J7TH95_METSI|nr:hypothetical protein CR492_09755 [Methylocella silvestris]